MNSTIRGYKMFRQGTVKWYDDKKHFGFITEDGSSTDLFFHKSNILTQDQNIEKDQRVEFDVKKTDRGLEAIEVKTLND